MAHKLVDLAGIVLSLSGVTSLYITRCLTLYVCVISAHDLIATRGIAIG